MICYHIDDSHEMSSITFLEKNRNVVYCSYDYTFRVHFGISYSYTLSKFHTSSQTCSYHKRTCIVYLNFIKRTRLDTPTADDLNPCVSIFFFFFFLFGFYGPFKIFLFFFSFFFFGFGFYGPFKNISLISSRSFIEGGRKPENPEKNHLTIRDLAFSHMTRATVLSTSFGKSFLAWRFTQKK